MTNEDYLKRIRECSEELRKDPVRLKAFMREVMGPPSVTLEGKEKAQTMLLLALSEPFKQTNNQQSWTDYYMIGGTEYHVTTWPGSSEPTVDKMLPEDEDESTY
jgi:hypothetical protein